MVTSYLNPVYPHPFADPFVLKHCGEYWAYCTGVWRDGRWFGVLRSRDLVRWEDQGGAMEPLAGDWPCRWAPEVSYADGRFYLYYSLGDEATMHIRVAVAERPAGPFKDCGVRLTSEPFAIDPHVFVDDDGARHLFYATDYLEHSHVGTGTARARLGDPLTLAGAPAPVTRPRYDWQVYDPARAAKGGVRWHTIEGPFVLKRKGRYYQMFSGGNWQNPSYGVSYAVAEWVEAEEWAQAADGAATMPILRTVPGEVIGPGHNSVVRGPDNRELYCVYHRWAADGSGRLIAIDPLDWAGERMFLLGPSTTPQPLALSTYADFFDGAGDGLGPAWSIAGGRWSRRDSGVAQSDSVAARASFNDTPPAFLAEVSVAALDPAAPGGYGFALGSDAQFLLEPARRRAVARLRVGAERWEEHPLALPADFAPGAFQLLRVEVNAGRAAVSVGEGLARWEVALIGAPAPLALVTAGAPAAFAGFALTEGWEDRFDSALAPAALGWEAAPRSAVTVARDTGPIGGWQIVAGALRLPEHTGGATMLKGPLPAAYELAVSLAVSGAGAAMVYPAAREGDMGPALTLERARDGFALSWAGQPLPLPAGFDGGRFHQLRLRVVGGRMTIALEGEPLGALLAPLGGTGIGLAGHSAAFELVRVTATGE